MHPETLKLIFMTITCQRFIGTHLWQNLWIATKIVAAISNYWNKFVKAFTVSGIG